MNNLTVAFLCGAIVACTSILSIDLNEINKTLSVTNMILER